MDENKNKVLVECGYAIRKVCGLCACGIFPGGDWGTCAARQYDHKKHSGPSRQVSIHKFGACWKFELAANKADLLGAFEEFVES